MKQPTRQELEELYAPLPRVLCGTCGEMVPKGSVCPRSIECPTCGARPGSFCLRPSGHGAMEIHKARWKEAERLDADPRTTKLSFRRDR